MLVVEQEAGGLFNRGKLINVGMHHAGRRADYYCLHDVDAVPVVANYHCPSQPLRLVNRILGADGETQSHATTIFPARSSMRKEQAFAANGYSNEYWGWGKEDDDFFFRLLLAGCLCFYDTQGTFHDLPNPKQSAGRAQESGDTAAREGESRAPQPAVARPVASRATTV